MQLSEDNILYLQQELAGDFNLPAVSCKVDLMQALANCINHLISADFTRLVNIIYRIDISEKTLKKTLEERTNEDAGLLIAHLVIERLLQKQQMRAQFKPHPNIPDDDKW